MIINDVGIIDLDISNIGSLINTISTLNFNCLKIKILRTLISLKIIIPGVGSYDIAMSNIKNRNWLRHIKIMFKTQAIIYLEFVLECKFYLLWDLKIIKKLKA